MHSNFALNILKHKRELTKCLKRLVVGIVRDRQFKSDRMAVECEERFGRAFSS